MEILMTHEVQKDTYINADEKTRHALTFDMLISISDELVKHTGPCNRRFEALEKSKRKSITITSIFSFLGGFVAMICIKLFGK